MQLGRGINFDLNFRKNNTLIRLIYANAAVFLATVLVYIPFWLMGSETDPKLWISHWLSVPSNLVELATKPWSLLTYMFLHLDFLHLLVNMIMLFSIGQLFVQFFGSRKLFTVYITGGLLGGLLYVIAFNIFPAFREIASISHALGASASVMAIVFATCFYKPDFSIKLFLFGTVKLKFIALILLLIDLISITGENSGGHIAHIGGAALGYLFAKQWLKGKDITAVVGKISDFFQSIFKSSPKPKMKVAYKRTSNSDDEYRSRKKEEQELIDRILDKISKSGYDSLSKAEKEILFKASNK